MSCAFGELFQVKLFTSDIVFTFLSRRTLGLPLWFKSVWQKHLSCYYLFCGYAVELFSVNYSCVISINHNRWSIKRGKKIWEKGIRQNPRRTRPCVLVFILFFIACQPTDTVHFCNTVQPFIVINLPFHLQASLRIYLIQGEVCSFPLPSLHLSDKEWYQRIPL